MTVLLLLIFTPAVLAGFSFAIRSDVRRPWMLFIAAVLHTSLVIGLWFSDRQSSVGMWLSLDPAGKLVLSLISALFLAASVYAVGYLHRRSERPNRTFVASLLFFLSATSAVSLSQHFGLLWVALEATTLASAPLLYFNHNPRSLEATWKYLLICSVGIALALLGTLFLAMAETLQGPVQDALFLPAMLPRAGSLSVPWLHAAFIFLLVGYGTKMGLAPMHTWKPDAYGEAPGLVGFLLSGVLTSCAFLALFRLTQVCQAAGQMDFARPLLVFVGLLSMGVAAAFMLGQTDYKRMLAYSSVEHMGILTLALGLGGLATYGAWLHMLNNGLAKGVLFLTAGNIHRHYKTKTASEVEGVLHRLPLSGALFMAGFIAITGSPPFGLFISEFTILRGAIGSGHWGIVAGYLGFLAVIFIGMARIVLPMVLGEPPSDATASGPKDSFLTTFTPILLLAAVLVLGLYIPSWLDRSLDAAARLAGGLP
ncbi:MAG: hydrogenase [Candidatus Omnitrophica bacterium]|nr:hydrogenase [Candidatus Omnitrophota bacterium]